MSIAISAPGRAIMFEPVNIPLSNLASFGSVAYLFGDAPHKQRRSLLDTGQLIKSILDQLSEIQYSPDNDVIVITGHISAVAIMVSAVASMYGTFRAVVYDAKSKKYIERKLGQDVIADE